MCRYLSPFLYSLRTIPILIPVTLLACRRGTFFFSKQQMYSFFFCFGSC